MVHCVHAPDFDPQKATVRCADDAFVSRQCAQRDISQRHHAFGPNHRNFAKEPGLKQPDLLLGRRPIDDAPCRRNLCRPKFDQVGHIQFPAGKPRHLQKMIQIFPCAPHKRAPLQTFLLTEHSPTSSTLAPIGPSPNTRSFFSLHIRPRQTPPAPREIFPKSSLLLRASNAMVLLPIPAFFRAVSENPPRRPPFWPDRAEAPKGERWAKTKRLCAHARPRARA